ncbi:hypothetical protein AZF37_02785 [endosymbiont 'TC1' of Trimyema compressum]|uniref:phosphatase PAP2 family protein n=1 Tax=endosymbiont 'TC1' of Trimyema compressum TaxID=243899 RepID=UPI0007F14A27|nr:phosphatase PAP2 family protein [endosymbiont 'TC1' of Trimyema compressum]AMP20241.1 hypothetical protein AZF37_02785 [endosymbiont 'TC1' of Trimyema compressum]
MVYATILTLTEKLARGIIIYVLNNTVNRRSLYLAIISVYPYGEYPFFDSLFLIITKLGDLGFIWILFSIVLLITKKYRLLGVLVLFNLLLTTVEVELLKHFVGRPRPFVVLPISPVLVSEAPMASFPSGHSATSFAAAIMLSYGLPKYKNYFLGLAVLIAISRLYLAVHFPTYVLMGAIIGSLTSTLILYFYMRIKGRKPRFQ